MKRNQLLVLSVLVFGLQGVAQASPYPADADAVQALPGIESVAFVVSGTHTQAHPADADAVLAMPGNDGATAWGVSQRRGSSESPFPATGEFRIDD
jgi:hypothetical protein